MSDQERIVFPDCSFCQTPVMTHPVEEDDERGWGRCHACDKAMCQDCYDKFGRDVDIGADICPHYCNECADKITQGGISIQCGFCSSAMNTTPTPKETHWSKCVSCNIAICHSCRPHMSVGVLVEGPINSATVYYCAICAPAMRRARAQEAAESQHLETQIDELQISSQ